MQKALVLAQLPPKVRSIRFVDMSASQARHYRELVSGLATMTDGGPLFSTNALGTRVRLMQFASAAVEVDTHQSDNIWEWDVNLVEPSSKLDELEAILDELGDKQVVVCAQHRKLIELAAARLYRRGTSHALITGKIPEYERQLNLRNFQEGRVQVLLFTISAGGTGLTMTAADTIIFLQRSDSMVDNKQAEDRVHRIGSEVHESIHVIDIVSRDTVEEDQMELLHEKLLRLDEITRDRAVLAERGVDTTSLDEEEEQIMGFKL
jgi:SNF2 family DNA or RNA helicase